MARLDGQVALVTGASTGVGRAAAHLLAAEGAAVAVTARRASLLDQLAAEMEAQGGVALPVAADLGDAASIQSLFDTVMARFGRLDILVNNAGTNVKRRGLAETAVQDWREIVDVNLTGVFLLCRLALPVMLAHGGGTVVHVSSMAAKAQSLVSGAAYSAAKYGMIALHNQLLLEGRAGGVRSCIIFPGDIDTPLLEKRPAMPTIASRATMMTAEDVAAAIVFAATLPPRTTVEEIVMRPTNLLREDEPMTSGVETPG